MELAIELKPMTRYALAAAFFLTSLVFVWRSFYGMRIETAMREDAAAAARETPASIG